MKTKNLEKTQFSKSLIITAVLITVAANVMAQSGGGAAGIEAATDEVTSYFDPAVKLMYAAGAIMGLVGAFKVYSKWNSGDPDTQKVAAGWFGSSIFLVIVATVLKAFFQ